MVFFTVEYVLRLWTANEEREFHRPFVGNFRYALTPFAIIDLLAILPFYLPLFGIDLRFIRMIRLLRLFRLLKVVRYFKALQLIADVFKEKREELYISLILTFILLLFTSTIMYYIESAVQPEHFASIPETMCWGISTLTTVGYGDVYPITPLGKVAGGITVILGIGLFALPTGILASGFSEHLSKSKGVKERCPHCGK